LSASLLGYNGAASDSRPKLACLVSAQVSKKRPLVA
jgi:hypothetical protein